MATPMWINEHDAWEFLFRFTEAYHLRGHFIYESTRPFM